MLLPVSCGHELPLNRGRKCHAHALPPRAQTIPGRPVTMSRVKGQLRCDDTLGMSSYIQGSPPVHLSRPALITAAAGCRPLTFKSLVSLSTDNRTLRSAIPCTPSSPALGSTSRPDTIVLMVGSRFKWVGMKTGPAQQSIWIGALTLSADNTWSKVKP